MPRRLHDDYLEDDEYPDPDDADEDSADTIPCPYCRKPIFEEAERCPYCENYLSQEDAPSHVPPWLAVGALLALAAALTWVFMG